MSEAERAARLREQRLTKALRANLRRRKAPRGTAETIDAESEQGDDCSATACQGAAASPASEKSQDRS